MIPGKKKKTLTQPAFALGSRPLCTCEEGEKGVPRLPWLINQKLQSELLTSLSMLCSHIMQYTCFTLLIMTRRHCGGLVWAFLNCLWCFMHGVDPWLDECLNAALREQPVQPRCGPVWVDLVESVDLVLLPSCTNTVRSRLIQVYCRLKSALRLMFSFEVVIWEILF